MKDMGFRLEQQTGRNSDRIDGLRDKLAELSKSIDDKIAEMKKEVEELANRTPVQVNIDPPNIPAEPPKINNIEK